MNITYLLFFFFNDTATTEIYTLSLHDALPISEADLGEALRIARRIQYPTLTWQAAHLLARAQAEDRKSTRLNSSHSQISYAVFCLKKKKRSVTADQLPSTVSREPLYLTLNHRR